jgi:drug/metabolite transporter (DMT)-like permease
VRYCPAMTALVYILLCLIWGSTWIGIKIGLQEAPPLYTASFRFALAVAILGAIALARKYRFPSTLKAWLRLGYPGLYMFGVSYGLVYMAEQYIASSLMAVLFGSFPFFIAAFSTLRLKEETLHRTAWIGLVVGFAGVIVISYQQWQLSQELFLGTMLGIGGTVAAAHGLVIHKMKFSRENIVVAVCVQMICGGIPLLGLACLLEDPADFSVNAASVGSVVYLAVFGSVVAFLGYYWLLKRTTVVVVSLIAFITPLVAIIIGVILFDESMTGMVIAGSAMILSGIVAVVRKPSKLEKRPG